MIESVAMNSDSWQPNVKRARELMLQACEDTAAMDRLRREHSAIARRRRARILKANRFGMSYQEMAASCRMSEAVITREIRQAREETNDPDLAARLPTRRPGV